MGDKCKLIRPKAPRMGDKCGRQVQMQETRVNPYGPNHPDWDTSVGDKWQTSANSYGPKHQGHPGWETSVGDRLKCGKQV